MRNTAIGFGIAFLLGTLGTAAANECPPTNPNAIGTSRTITVKPVDYPLVGRMQYQETLPLKNREVVITFDDGPVAPYTNKILETLAAECVKATFFTLGTNVAEAPELVRRASKEGHTIGTHTFSHQHLSKMPFEQAKKEIDLGIAATTEALGNARDVAPFFRAPYLDITKELEKYLFSRGIMLWSIDVAAEDWIEMTEERLVDLAVTRLERAGKGILLLHDMKPVTARALPNLLAELKRRNFRIVHVVPGMPIPGKTTKVDR
jgi:peptidoglycan/xylan/chitin deacetylase (PgdA/CDA1 family)